MATKVVMEALSPTMEEGRLVKWLKAEGDTVKNGDVLAEVETDKVVMELVARGDGVLRKQLAAEGDSSAVGTLLGVIAGADENIDQLVGAGGGGGGGGAPPAKPASTPAPREASADGGAQQNGGRGGRGAQPNDVVASQRERAGASPVPRSNAEAQGEASMPPQQKVPGGAGATPAQPQQGRAPAEGEGN